MAFTSHLRRKELWFSILLISIVFAIPNSNLAFVGASSSQTGSTTDTIGGTTGSDDFDAQINIFAITASASGTLDTIGVNVQTASGNIAVAIYSTFSSSSGTLSGLLGQSSSTSAVTGWNDLPIPGRISIVSGTTYYVGFIQSSYNLKAYYDSSGTDYLTGFTYGPFPSSANLCTSCGSASEGTINMRMTYSSVSVSTSTTTQPTTTGTTTVASTTTTTSVTSPSTSTSTTRSTTITSSTSSTLTSTSTSQTVTASNQPCSYEVFMSGSTTYAENCATGVIAYSGALPETVINDAIAQSSGGSVYIEPGTYTFTTLPVAGTGAIGSSSVSNVELYGAGNSTILQAGTNLNGAVIALWGPSGWFIHDLQVNGNAASQSANGAGLPLSGISLTGPSSSNNDVVEHCYIHDAKTYGIGIGPGSNEQVLDNWVQNSWANGIIVGGGGGNDLVEGNIVDGASDVGISISGSNNAGNPPITNVLVTGNTVLNINMHISPFGQNTGAGLYAGDNGYAQNVTFSNNYVSTGTYGIVSDPYTESNSAITISGNTVVGFTKNGVYAEETNGLTISGNTFSLPASALAWWVDTDCTNVVIQNNYVNGVLET